MKKILFVFGLGIVGLIKWKKDQPVSYLYNSLAPDVGAFERVN